MTLKKMIMSIDTKSFALFGANSLSDIEEDSVVYVYASDDKI